MISDGGSGDLSRLSIVVVSEISHRLKAVENSFLRYFLSAVARPEV